LTLIYYAQITLRHLADLYKSVNNNDTRVPWFTVKTLRKESTEPARTPAMQLIIEFHVVVCCMQVVRLPK